MKKPGYVRVGAIGATMPGFGPLLVSAVKMTNIDSELAPMNGTGSLWLLLGVLTPTRVILFPDGTSTKIDLAPGQLILLPGDCRYRVDTRMCRSGSRHYWLQFDRVVTDPRFDMLLQKRRDCALFRDPDGILFDRLESLIQAIGQYKGEPFWLLQARGSAITRLLFESERAAGGIRHISPASDVPPADPLVDRALSYLQNQLSQSVRLPAMARHLNVSSSTLSHRYRKATGEGPIETLHRMRILRAKDMLVRGAPLKAITFDLGYYDEHHFSRAFKKTEGVSPLEFARQVGTNRPMLGPSSRQGPGKK